MAAKEAVNGCVERDELRTVYKCHLYDLEKEGKTCKFCDPYETKANSPCVYLALGHDECLCAEALAAAKEEGRKALELITMGVF